MSSTMGKQMKIMTFGESHGEAVGVVIDGIKPGLKIDKKDIQKELDKRKPGKNILESQRKEKDEVHILSGIFNGKTTGHPICMVVYNKAQNPKDYARIKDIFRPGHADYTYFRKYGIRDYRGGGRASGRETIGRVAAGAVAKKILAKKNIKIVAYTVQIADIKAKNFELKQISRNKVGCPDKMAAHLMEKRILEAKKEGDSVGGIIEVYIKNCPIGLGDPVFDRLDANIAKAVMSIGAVKGIEFGAGFKAAMLKGSENNDEFFLKAGKIKTKTNNAGGILGGISNGEDIVFRIAVKPTASISKEQETVDVNKKMKKIRIKGRHDPCICQRVIPVVESMTSIVIADAILEQETIR